MLNQRFEPEIGLLGLLMMTSDLVLAHSSSS